MCQEELRERGAKQAGLSRRDCTQKHSVVRQELRKHNPSIVSGAGYDTGCTILLRAILSVVVLVQRLFLLGEKTMSGLKRLASLGSVLLTMLLFGFSCAPLRAQTLDENALKAMKWRQVGPFRG